jgi:spermidine/putrescine transport system substrate-binding protein
LLKASVAALSGFALAQCGWRQGSVQRTSTPATASDKLYIYTWSQYTDEDLLNSFTSQTGIKVVADVFDSNETMLARLQAGGGANYSVIYPSDYMVRRMMELGLLSQLDSSRLTGLDNLLPRFQNPEYDPDNRHSVPMSWGTTGFVYNSEKLAVAPTDWDYLWAHQQELSKRMTLLNDVREVMGGTLRMLGYSYNSQDESQIKQAYERLQTLKPAIAAFDTDAWQNQILAGDLLLAMSYSADAIRVSQENPSLRYVIPRSGSSLWTDTMAIPNTAPNPNAAYAWINFMLQPDVAAQMCQRLSIATPNQVAVEQLPPELRNNTNLFPPESILQNCERIAPLGEVDAVYERYWTQLTSG